MDRELRVSTLITLCISRIFSAVWLTSRLDVPAYSGVLDRSGHRFQGFAGVTTTFIFHFVVPPWMIAMRGLNSDLMRLAEEAGVDTPVLDYLRARRALYKGVLGARARN